MEVPAEQIHRIRETFLGRSWRGDSSLKDSEQLVLEMRSVGPVLSCLGGIGHRWGDETGW